MYTGKKPCSPALEASVLLLWFLQNITVLVVLLLLHQTACAEIANNEGQRCLPSSCGKIINISHPFRLKGDPPNCGDRRYELACEDNVTVLSLFSGKYHVQAINYSNFTVRLADPGIQQDDCSSIPRYFLARSNFTDSYNFSFSYQSQDPYLSTTNYHYFYYDSTRLFQDPVIYLKCRSGVRDDPKYVNTAPCVNWQDSKWHFYAVAGDLPLSKLKSGCHVMLAALTSSPFMEGYYDSVMQSNQTFSYAEIHSMLAYGFYVSWIGFACESYCGPRDYCLYSETGENNLQCTSRYCDALSLWPNSCGKRNVTLLDENNPLYIPR